MYRNHINPFQVASHRDPKNNHIINDEPFNMIQLRTRPFTWFQYLFQQTYPYLTSIKADQCFSANKVEYITKWLGSLDVNNEMLESDNMEQGFQTNYLSIFIFDKKTDSRKSSASVVFLSLLHYFSIHGRSSKGAFKWHVSAVTPFCAPWMTSVNLWYLQCCICMSSLDQRSFLSIPSFSFRLYFIFMIGIRFT